VKISSLNDKSKAELIARLCAIDIVSWRWNVKGLLVNLLYGHFSKLRNNTEEGVIAQNVRDELSDYFPGVTTTSRAGVLRVDYGMLANIAYEVLPYIEARYKLSPVPPDDGSNLILSDLLRQYLTNDTQLAAVRLLALVQLYKSHTLSTI
jgi:hypothetical protein